MMEDDMELREERRIQREMVIDPALDEPPCECLRTDVDFYDDSFCELHNPRSAWNRSQS
jgi:hypothetical protein